MSYKIIYENDTEIAEYEAIIKGYRTDVIVVIDNKRYKLYITDMIRLHQDFDLETEDGGPYQNEPNTIIVKEVSKKEIEKTVERLVKDGFFDDLGYTMIVNDYNSREGIKLNWNGGYKIEVNSNQEEIVISANIDGLLSLANHLIALAQSTVPTGTHIHLDEYNSLEEGSVEMVIQKID